MSATLLAGFGAIAGVLAGFLTARLAPLRIFVLLLIVSLLAGGLATLALRVPLIETDPWTLIAVFVAVAPFAICVVFAGGIGLLARRIATRRDAS
ncbi:hypothetical protein [Gymnodinialimonas sp.]